MLPGVDMPTTMTEFAALAPATMHGLTSNIPAACHRSNATPVDLTPRHQLAEIFLHHRC